ncbi:MAG TPA: exosortase K, partial [Bacteroidia bacterium]
MKISKTTIYQICIILCILLLFASGKILYKYGNTEAFDFLIKPVATAVAIYYDSNYHYNSDHGFAFDDLMIVIDKSCSGFNFFTICMVSMLLIMAITPIDKKKTLLTISMIPLIAYFA